MCFNTSVFNIDISTFLSQALNNKKKKNTTKGVEWNICKFLSKPKKFSLNFSDINFFPYFQQHFLKMSEEQAKLDEITRREEAVKRREEAVKKREKEVKRREEAVKRREEEQILYFLMSAYHYCNDPHNNNDTSLVEFLLDNGADINKKDGEGCTPLHIASTLEMAKILIERGADFEAVNNKGETPLICHSSCGRVDIVNYLISKGASKETKTYDGQTAYDVACDECPENDREQVKAELQRMLS